jgi:hypothetical protein
MRYALLLTVAGFLFCGTVGCQFKSMPMDQKDFAEHPLAAVPDDYRGQIFLNLGATYSRTDLHFSRWDFSTPQGWKEGRYWDDRPMFGVKYMTRCDVDVTILKEDHQDQHKHYVYVIDDSKLVPATLPNTPSTSLLAPTSAVPYSPFDIALNQVAALSSKVPDKSWTVEDHLTGVKARPGVMAYYIMHNGQMDSAVYIVEKLRVYSGWSPGEGIKAMPVGENPVYFVFATKGTAWPTFEKDAMATLFTGSPDDMYAAVGTRNIDK